MSPLPSSRPGSSSSPPPSASPSQLAGSGDADAQESAPQDSPAGGDTGLKAATEQIRGFMEGMLGMAKQYPAAAPDFRNAAHALRGAMKKIVANPGQAEPAAPAISG